MTSTCASDLYYMHTFWCVAPTANCVRLTSEANDAGMVPAQPEMLPHCCSLGLQPALSSKMTRTFVSRLPACTPVSVLEPRIEAGAAKFLQGWYLRKHVTLAALCGAAHKCAKGLYQQKPSTACDVCFCLVEQRCARLP